MAGEFPVPADKLKKLIKQSIRMPIPFGFNPGLSDDNDEYLAAHARKMPEMMGKIALHEGDGTKSAFGTFSFADSELHLTCFRVVPQLAKKFKRYLKSAKITLNVVVFDADGTILDSDVEELEDAFDAAGVEADTSDEPDAVAAAPAPAAAQGAAPGAAPVAAPPPRPRSIDPAVAAAAALSDRLKRLQPQVAAAPPPVAQKLGALFKAAIAMVREGKLKEGTAAVTALEQTFSKIGKAPGAPAAPAAPAAAPARDSRLPKLRDALIKLEDRAVRLLGDAAEMILDDLEPLAAQIDLGEGDAVLKALREAQAQIAALAGARAKWDKIAKRLAPKLEAALSGSAPAALRTRWKLATGLADVGDWPRALAAVPGIVNLLKDVADGPAPDPARMKSLWQAAVDAAEGADPATMAEVGAQLESVFDALRDTTDAAERRELQARAAGLVAEARAAQAA